MSQNNGGPAFPAYYANKSGMSLRDWFAGMAMQALLQTGPCNWCGKRSADDSAALAYRLADAMLSQRTQEKGG